MTECRYYEMCARRAGSRDLPPSCDRRSCWMFRPMPDVDALLALAEELESGARVARARKWNNPANAAMAIALANEYEANARRIREACGVSDDA